MGKTFYACCVCGCGTTESRRHSFCDGCGASYCSNKCCLEAVEPTQDGECYCIDCCNVDDMEEWVKAGSLNIKQTKVIFKNATNKLNKNRLNERRNRLYERRIKTF